jgi:uncharacterized membrane protein YhhN
MATGTVARASWYNRTVGTWLGGVAVAVAVIAALANWWSRWCRADPRAAAVEHVSKPVTTMALGVLAIVVSDGAPGAARVAAVVAFAWCLVGDVLLLPRVDRFVPGLAAFLLGHVAFAVMFVALGLEAWVLAGVAFAGVVVLVAVVGSRIVAGAVRSSAALRVPVVAYLMVISAMAVLGWWTGLVAALVGSALFVLSDSVLGWNRFVASARWMDLAVMMTYHGALAGLALSLA